MPQHIYDLMYDDEKPIYRSDELRTAMLQVRAMSSSRNSNKLVRDVCKSANARVVVALVNACNGRNALPPPESSQPAVARGKLALHRSSSSLSFGSKKILVPAPNVDEPKADEPKIVEPNPQEPRAEDDEKTQTCCEGTLGAPEAAKDNEKTNKEKDKATHETPKKTFQVLMTATTKVTHRKRPASATTVTPRKRPRSATTVTPMKMPGSAAIVVSNSQTPTKLKAGVMLWKKAKISCSDSKGGWRVWPDKSVVGKEKLIKYTDDEDEAWNRVLSFLKQ